MEIIKEYITKDESQELLELIKKQSLREASGYNRRVGLDGVYSNYSSCHFFYFNEDLAQRVLELTDWKNKANEIWLLKIPKGGSLGLTIGRQEFTSTIESIALQDKTGVNFNQAKAKKIANAGDMYKFELRVPHEVKEVSQDTYFLVSLHL